MNKHRERDEDLDQASSAEKVLNYMLKPEAPTPPPAPCLEYYFELNGPGISIAMSVCDEEDCWLISSAIDMVRRRLTPKWRQPAPPIDLFDEPVTDTAS